MLKIVEIIGEDEISDLDPETVYFITHLLNKANLLKFRNRRECFSVVFGNSKFFNST